MEDVFGFVLELIGVGLDVSDRDPEAGERRRSAKRRKILESGGAFTIRCKLRWPQGGAHRWRAGKLRLSRPQAVWVPRFRSSRAKPLDHRALQAKSTRLTRKRAVVTYHLRGSPLELTVRRRDLGDLARLFELPPQR